MLTREQLIENITAMEEQGAPQEDIQAYLDAQKEDRTAMYEQEAAQVPEETTYTPPKHSLDTMTEEAVNFLDKFGPGGTKIGARIGGDKSIRPKQIAGDVGRIATSLAASVLPSPASFSGTLAQFGGIGAAGAGSYAAAQDKTPREIFADTLKGGALGLLFGAGTYGLGKGAEAVARKAMTTEIRPRTIDLEDGFQLENVQKYKLGYSLKQIAQNADKQLDDLQTQLAREVAESTDVVDLNSAVGRTERRLLAEKGRNFGLSPNIDKAVQGLRDEVDNFTAGEGLASIPEAQTLKRSTGHLGAWLYGAPDPDASAREKVYNIFYNELKKEVENALPAGVARTLNKKMQDLIPIINAVARRIPIAERNSAISLPEVISLTGAVFDPSALGITGLRLMTTMGAIGGRLQPFGQAVQQAAPALRAGSSQVIPNLSQEGLAE